MRKKLRARIALAIVLAITTLVIVGETLRESDVSMYYGAAPIKLANRTVYVKARDCGAICSGWLWISQNPDRCVREDEKRDYIGTYNNVTYAMEDNTLVLAEYPRGWKSPSDGDWLHSLFIPWYGHAADTYPIRHIVFGSGEALPEWARPGIQIELRPCIRFFGHTWN